MKKHLIYIPELSDIFYYLTKISNLIKDFINQLFLKKFIRKNIKHIPYTNVIFIRRKNKKNKFINEIYIGGVLYKNNIEFSIEGWFPLNIENIKKIKNENN